jgi:hypothetical protein
MGILRSKKCVHKGYWAQIMHFPTMLLDAFPIGTGLQRALPTKVLEKAMEAMSAMR